MNQQERRSVGLLSGIIALRMFGLFLMIPIIALYADDLPGATPLLVGVALGIYGLTQALFQIPFGLMSDKLGRRPLITFGLCLFVVGSLTAGLIHSIWGLLAGRALQGAGAISSVIMALAADSTRESQRTKAMALIGMTIGIAFTMAFLAAPYLQAHLGVPGMFFLVAFLAALAIFALWFGMPRSVTMTGSSDRNIRLNHVVALLKDKILWRLDLSVACLHGILAMTFVALPFVLHQSLGISKTDQAWIYVPVLLLSFVLMLPLLIVAEKHKRTKQVFQLAILLLAASLVTFWLIADTLPKLLFALGLFFTGFNLLEASLPSWISKVAPKEYKGTALGVYATSQFLGFFAGGLISGIVLQYFAIRDVFAVALAISLAWLATTRGLSTAS